MLTLTTKLSSADRIDGTLRLPFELREKSRLRARLESGEEVALFTQRGTVLRDGDLLAGDDNRVIRVIAAEEATYRVSASSSRELLRCAFHLGNRHTQAQVGSDTDGDFLRIRKDPVLKEMLEGLGAVVAEQDAPFEPEAGAYGGGHHHHGDSLLAPVPLRQKIHRPLERE
ncbi:urease accessory protein UreE [Noviherbaspirillum pedocola]|uniref:Urease accessory protein UreE n=1 Tax=Noviherbaspirillum pedocola TaxID=2801341 RepID=A0A934STU5_9BURK|nr:urease accessory protein UreE [Noviherbaspirillum pedocola]MBK4735577.1 urease accessory protein UreE [Noviherbaspirillum pedocola]